MPLVTLLRQEIKAIKHFQNDRAHSDSHFSCIPVLFFKGPFMILILNSLKLEESVESVEFLKYSGSDIASTHAFIKTEFVRENFKTQNTIQLNNT